MEIKEYLNKPVFLVGNDGTREMGELTVCESFEELNDHLKLRSPASDPNIFILHGIIFSAKYIPGEIEGEVYIVIQNPADDEMGCIYETLCECDAGVISRLVMDKIEPKDGLDFSFENVTIDNIFLMYGYELDPGYSVSEEELDDESLHACVISSQNAEKMMREVACCTTEKKDRKKKQADDALATLEELYMWHFQKKE